MQSEEILNKHIKIQREECIKNDLNSEKFLYHWELMNLLCEIGGLREAYTSLFEILACKEIIMKKESNEAQ